MATIKKENIGSDFDDFLREEGILHEVEAVAYKAVVAWQIHEEMKKKNLSKTALAKLMKTSRSAIDRLLDPENSSITLNTLAKAADIFGGTIKLEFVMQH